jgi:hypothetical protein
MANYYTEFSFTVALPNKEALVEALDLYRRCGEDESTIPEELESVREQGVGFHLEEESNEQSNEQYPPTLWFHSEDGGNIDSVCMFIQYLLKKNDMKNAVGFEYALTCSKPRIDAFGGGACMITADKIDGFNSGVWLLESLGHLGPCRNT